MRRLDCHSEVRSERSFGIPKRKGAKGRGAKNGAGGTQKIPEPLVGSDVRSYTGPRFWISTKADFFFQDGTSESSQMGSLP